jgi:PAS domain S-box-containing protein
MPDIPQALGVESDLQQSQRRVTELEERLRVALETAPLVVFNQDRNLRYTWVHNPTRGFAIEDILGRTDEELITQKDAEPLMRIKRQVLKTGVGARTEIELTTGGIRNVYDLNVDPLRDADGQIIGITCVALDITERKHAEELLKFRVEQQTAIVELGQQALSSTNISSLLQTAAAVTAKILRADYCGILELTSDAKALIVRACIGWEPTLRDKVAADVTGSPSGYALAHNQPVIFEDLKSETRFRMPDLHSNARITSGAVIVIPATHQPFGVLSALSTKPRRFTEDDVHFLQSVANIIATAVERQSLEREVLEIAENEQRRIGQDLHDAVCQNLISAGLFAKHLESLLAKGSVGHAAKAGEIAQLICDTAAQVREIARGLTPVDLNAESLLVALRELAEGTQARSRIVCWFHCASKGAVVRDNNVAYQLFRIAQEAVNNAVKHSRAKHIRIKLHADERKIELSITDDGIGLPTGAKKAKGMGLHTMSYRANLINASLLARRRPKGGTSVRCLLELENRRLQSVELATKYPQFGIEAAPRGRAFRHADNAEVT